MTAVMASQSPDRGSGRLDRQQGEVLWCGVMQVGWADNGVGWTSKLQGIPVTNESVVPGCFAVAEIEQYREKQARRLTMCMR